MTTKTVAVGGDSQTTYLNNLGVSPVDCWPEALGRGLRAGGKDVRARGFGINGNTTTTLLDRLNDLFLFDTPEIAGLYIGVNDPGNSILQATTQLNIEAMCMALKHGARGDGLGAPYVAGQANLPATGRLGQRYVVLSDTSTTGGVAEWHSSHTATITGTVSGANVWEFRQPLAGENGWGRVARATTAPSVVDKIFVVGANYLNWTSGGDTTSVDYSTYATVRAAQAAAVAAQNVTVAGRASVVFVDLHAFQKARLVAGIDLNFRSVSYDQARSWHVADANQHHSAYGHALVAQAVQAAIPSAWLNDLDAA